MSGEARAIVAAESCGACGADDVPLLAICRGCFDELDAARSGPPRPRRLAPLLTVDQVADYLQLSRQQIRDLIARGRLQAIDIAQSTSPHGRRWRIRPKDEELPAYLRERLGELVDDPEVDAVGEAASATIHLFSWRNRDRQLLGRWVKRRGTEAVEVEVFVHRTTERRPWRRVGTLEESGALQAMGESDVEALRKSRFNRIVVIDTREGP